MPAERVETQDHEPAEGDYSQEEDEVGREPGKGQPDPALASSVRQCRQERRKLGRKDEKPTQVKKRLKRKEKRIKMTMINSDSSSSEEETCQEIMRMTLDKTTEPWDGAVYNNTTKYYNNNTEYYNKINKVENSGCGIIKLSGQVHIEHHPCYDQHDEGEDENEIEEEDQDGDEIDDDDPNVHDDSNVQDDSTDEEDIKPEFDNDTTKFEIRGHEPEEGDRHQEDDEAVR